MPLKYDANSGMFIAYTGVRDLYAFGKDSQSALKRLEEYPRSPRAHGPTLTSIAHELVNNNKLSDETRLAIYDSWAYDVIYDVQAEIDDLYAQQEREHHGWPS